MVTCIYPWSSRDLFDIYNDCRIYQPVYLLLNSLIFIGSFICFIYGVYDTFQKKKKEIAISAGFLGLFLTLDYGVMLGANISFGDKNIGLNMLHGLSLSLIWLNINLQGSRHLEVIKSVDAKTVVKAQKLLKWLMRFNYITFIISLILELSGMILPAIILSIDPIKLLGPVQLILAAINTIPHLAYAYRLRQIIINVQSALGESPQRQSYEPVRKTLETRLTSNISSLIFAEITILCWMLIPILRYNIYILYNVQMIFAPLTGFLSVWDTRNTQSNDTSPTTRPSLKSGTRPNQSGQELSQTNRSQTHTITTTTERGRSPSRSEEGLPLVSLDKESQQHQHQHQQPEQQQESLESPKSELVPIFNPFTEERSRTATWVAEERIRTGTKHEDVTASSGLVLDNTKQED